MLTRNAPGHARADLKKLLQTNHVRKTTAQYILVQLGLVETDLSSSVRSDEGFHEDIPFSFLLLQPVQRQNNA